MNEETEYAHESYGMVSFSRINSSASNHFFGSSLPTNDYIQMDVVAGSMQESLSGTRFHAAGPRRNLIRCQMSPNAFAELITRMNVGDGIPCTVASFDNKEVEQAPKIENKKMATQRQFKERMKGFSDTLVKSKEQVSTILKKDKLSKADKDSIEWVLSGAIQEIERNMPFFTNQFADAMEKIVLEAKQQIDAAMMHKITSLGLNALQQENQNLLGNEDVNS